MCNALIHSLLLEEHLHMILLNHKRQLEVGNVERQVLRIEDAKHVDLLCNLLDAALQLANTRLLLRISLNHMLENLL